MKRTLVLIPARGGSKGIPHKNIKNFCGQPLIKYTIDFAKKHFPLNDICVSTDSNEIIEYVKSLGLKIYFRRPDVLAQDTSSSRDVILHAIDFFKELGCTYEYIILLQPTTPIRNDNLIGVAKQLSCVDNDFDLVVSVKNVKTSPYFNLYEENEDGFLRKSKAGNFIRRQDSPIIYEFTGAFYFFRTSSIVNHEVSDFRKIRKIEINNPVENIDLDTPLDWVIGEFLMDLNNDSLKNI